MATIGCRYVVFAPIKTEEHGKAPVYDTGVVLGRSISMDMSYERNDSKLYADDTLAESDNSITGGTMTVGVDQFTPEGRVAALGVELVEVEGQSVYRTKGKAAPYGGLGIIEVQRYKGVTTYNPTWVYKTQFGPAGKSMKTKGESIDWQTREAQGDIMGTYIDDSGEPTFVDDTSFATEAEAIAWINKMANIA